MKEYQHAQLIAGNRLKHLLLSHLPSGPKAVILPDRHQRSAGARAVCPAARLVDFISHLRESDLSFLWLLWVFSSHNQHITARDLVIAEAV